MKKACCDLYRFYEQEMCALKELVVRIKDDVDQLKTDHTSANEARLRHQVDVLVRILDGVCRDKIGK